jgi:putative ATPase
LPQAKLTAEAGTALVRGCGQDARRLLGAMEVAADLAGDHTITVEMAAEALQSSWLAHDRDGESHFNITSAMIKSLRDSDVDAGLYWCMRLLEAGEDPLFVVRRLVILAAEDVGMADPRAIQIATSVKEAVAFVGMPEARIPIAMLCAYLGRAPKSNASYQAMHAALADIKEYGALPVPMVLRNAPTDLMKDLGYGDNYAYAHNDPAAATAQQHRPSEIEGRRYYRPGRHGFEGHFPDAAKKNHTNGDHES